MHIRICFHLPSIVCNVPTTSCITYITIVSLFIFSLSKSSLYVYRKTLGMDMSTFRMTSFNFVVGHYVFKSTLIELMPTLTNLYTT